MEDTKVPRGWVFAAVEDVISSDGTFTDGDWVETKDQDPNGDVRLIQLADIGDGSFLDKSSRFLTKSKAYELNCTFLNKGDLLVARMPDPLGRCCIFPFDGTEQFVTVVDVCMVRLGNSSINPPYLMFAINSPPTRTVIDALKSGSTRRRISRRNFAKVQIPLAPRNEQRRIVAKIEELFSELDKGVESLKTARAQLKVYRQAVLKHAFEGKLTVQWREENRDKLEMGAQLLTRIRRQRDALYEQQLKDWKVAIKNWEENYRQGKRPPKPRKYRETENIRSDEIDGLPSIPRDWRLVRLCHIAQIGTGMSVSATRTLEDPLNVPYLRVANVQRGYLDLSAVKTMTIEKSQLDRLQLKKWDVLFNEGGDRDKLGRGWIWQSQIAPCITQNHVFRASSFMASEFNSKIISYWANAFGQQYFEKKGKQTTNLASINKTVLSHFPIPLIPREEQEELCKQIEKLMTILDTQEQEITSAFRLAGLLRQSILKEAFSGELVKQDPNDEPAAVLLERIKAEKASQKPRAKTRQRKVANA